MTWTSNLPQLVQKEMPRIFAQALNQTAEQAQYTVRRDLGKRFTIRGPASRQFLERLVKIGPDDRARPDRLQAQVRVAPPNAAINAGGGEGARAKNVLFKHEKGGTKSGSNTRWGKFALPASDMRTAAGNPPRMLYPTALGIQPRRLISGGFSEEQSKGKRGTFVVKTKTGELGIFQRVGPDGRVFRRRADGMRVITRPTGQRSNIRPLWWFKDQIDLSPRLEFTRTVSDVARRQLPANARNAMLAAVQRLSLRRGASATAG